MINDQFLKLCFTVCWTVFCLKAGACEVCGRMIRIPRCTQFLLNVRVLVVSQPVLRGVWTSALYADGAKPMVKWLNMSIQEFRDLCIYVEEGSDIPKERYFDWCTNRHQLNNLRAFTSWGLTLEEQKRVVMSCPQLIERKTKHLDALRTWSMDKFEISANDFRYSFSSYPWLLSRATEWKVVDIVKEFQRLGFGCNHLQDLLRDAPRHFTSLHLSRKRERRNAASRVRSSTLDK